MKKHRLESSLDNMSKKKKKKKRTGYEDKQCWHQLLTIPKRNISSKKILLAPIIHLCRDEDFQTGQMAPVQLCYISFHLLLQRQFSGTHSHILFPFLRYSQQNLSLSISNSTMQCCRFRKCLAVFTAKSSRSRAGNSRNTSSEEEKQSLLSYCFPFHFTHSKELW